MLEPKQERSHATRRRLLDAAVQVLVEEGYAGISASTVARRAGVSRGAQQHHFANRQTLVVESVHYMSARELELLHERISAIPHGRSRIEGALDLIYELYSGTFFGAVLELSMASRRDPELREAVAEEEHSMSQTVQRLGSEILGVDDFANTELARRWTLAVATIRGLAVLLLLRHPKSMVDRQWQFARQEILVALGAESRLS